ncbi:MAG: X-Pro dipeptidyl-peptidase [Chloroflexi bacterium]|nr:X-Pro dipeptidyl-peptidase [Chloroflexota bacterium]
MDQKWRELISQRQYGIKVERNIYVPMRDGVRLAVNVFRPDTQGQFPALLALGGYGKELHECLIPPQPLFKSAVWDGNIEAGDTTEFVPRGYVHVICDARGTGKSEGEYYGGFTNQETEDGYELVEWAARQPWCNGNVGMIGYSYYGITQLKVATLQPPHLKAIAPGHILTDNYRETYAGGVLSLFLYGCWYGRHGTSGWAPRNAKSEMEKILPKAEFERRVQELLDQPDIKNYPNLFHLLNYPYKNPFFFDMLLNPFDNQFWKERSVYPFYDKIKVPTYVIGKVAHDMGAFWEVYNGIDAPKRILAKPRGPEERPWREDIELLVRWYDHWLKGNDTGIMEGPPIKMFVMGTNQYRYENEWPLKGIDFTKCFLRRWEGLSFEPELYQNEPDCFLQQPLHLSNKRDSVIYLSPALPAPVEAIGPASIHFFATIDQDDDNWIVSLSDVAPGGTEIGLAKGYLKASHRAIDPGKSRPGSPYHPHTSAEPVKPGEIQQYDLGLGILSNVFLAGHRLKLTIASLESPRDPEMQIHYHPHLCSARTTLHKIYRDRRYQSHLILPITSGKQAVLETMSDENFQGGV